MASIARDDPSTLRGDDPFPRARPRAPRPQCAVSWDRNSKPKLAIMCRCISATDRRTDIDDDAGDDADRDTATVAFSDSIYTVVQHVYHYYNHLVVNLYRKRTLYGSPSTATATILLLLLHTERQKLQKEIYRPSPSDKFAERAKQYC